MVAWTIDAASGLAFPANAVEEAAFIAANPAAGPAVSLIHNCQDASSDLEEADGGLPLTASGTSAYGTPVPGFTRKAVTIPDNGPNTGFFTTSGTLPDPSSGRYAMLTVARSLGTPAGGRGMMQVAQDNQIRVNTTPRLRMLLAGDDRQVAMDMDTDVHFYFTAVDEVANLVYAGWESVLTDAVHTTPASANRMIAVGGFDATAFGQDVLAIYTWLVTIPTKAELKARLQAIGKAVAWSP